MFDFLKKMSGLVPKFGANTAVSSYEGSSVGRRYRSVAPTIQGPNSLLSFNGAELRRRSRQTIRNNSWANNGLESYVSNTIGTGIKPQSQHPDDAIQIKLDEIFERWTDESDADGITDFYGQQSLICREMMESGECLVRFRPQPSSSGMFIPLELQLLESEHLPFWKNINQPNGNLIRNGIEFNKRGKRVNYWLYKQHPGELIETQNSIDIVPVSASEILHIYKPVRAGQFRGQPWLTSVMVRLEELDKYEDAELLRKQMAAMISHFITEEDPTTGNGLFDTDTQPDEDGTPIARIEPGSTVKLRAGENITVSQPADVGNMYGEFLRMNLYAVAAGMGITYEMLTGDLKGVNYSSIRAGLLEFRRRCEAMQHQVLVFQFCRPVWNAVMNAAALAGRISAKDYLENRKDYENVVWQPPKWQWVDPEKDVLAEKEAVRCGFKSQSDVINSLGENPDRVRTDIAADNLANDALGNRSDADGRFPLNGKPPALAAADETNGTLPAPLPQNDTGAPSVTNKSKKGTIQ